MPLTNVFEKLGKAIFETPFGANKIAKDAPELAEIRLAVLDAVKAKSHRASGKSVFPYNVVRIHLHGVPAEQAPIFESTFLGEYFQDEIKSGLSRSGYRFPDNLRIEVVTTPILPGAGEQWLTVETALEQPPAPAVKEQHPARLEIVKGNANFPQLLLDVTRTNIGRSAEVFRQAGPSRKNDLAFVEDNDVNRSVSREHAHILRSPANEYRLVNDRAYKGEENCGLWIVRDGLSLAVHRSARGTPLQAGDEIHLGNAVLIFHHE